METLQLQQEGIIELDKNLFDGYISEVDDGVIISFIESRNKGKGNFSRLLNELKQKYNWIKIPTPSGIMIDITLKKGFIIKDEYFPEPFNCIGTIMFWEKK